MEILAFETVYVQGLFKGRRHQQCINTISEPPTEKYLNSITTVMSYTCLKPRSGPVAVGPNNLTGNNIIIKSNTVVAKISAANVVPHMLAPKNPVGMTDKQTVTCLSEHHNTNKVGTHSDDLE